MDLELLKQKFHNLIDTTDNEQLLEHFYEIMQNLLMSDDKQKLFIDEISQFKKKKIIQSN